MEQRTIDAFGHRWLAIILFLALLASSLPALADQEGETPPTVKRADLEAAMKDAENEYQATLKAETSPTPPRPASPKTITDLTKALSPTRMKSTLEELASEVDTLNNKLIIERTTLLATQSPRKVKVRGARTIFNYSAEAVYEIIAAVDHITDVQLKPGETLTNAPTAGDTVRWNVAVMRSGAGSSEVTHVIIKPLDDSVETNLIITTDSHTYHLKLKSADFHMPAVSWNYPEDFAAQTQEILTRKKTSEQTAVSPEALHFGYQIEDEDYPWRPIRVFDDGKKTFIQMPKGLKVSEAPALFLIEDSSEPLLTNYRVKGDFYIVDRLFTKAELRVGPRQKLRIEIAPSKGFFERLFD